MRDGNEAEEEEDQLDQIGGGQRDGWQAAGRQAGRAYASYSRT